MELTGEHDPYYNRYVSLVSDGDISDTLEKQMPRTVALLSGMTDEKTNSRYAPGKWSIKEVLGHLTDTERIMCYRALRIARNDPTPIEGFEQDDYVRGADFNSLRLPNLLAEFTAVRQATILFFGHLSPEAWTRRGTASGKPVTVRALAYIIAGHELHHGNVIRTKY